MEGASAVIEEGSWRNWRGILESRICEME